MKKTVLCILRYVSLYLVFFGAGSGCFGQNTVPDVLYKGALVDQMAFINEKTKIYDNYRAIREDMFQLLRKNCIDSVKSARNEMTGLRQKLASGNQKIDSLNRSLEDKSIQLDKATSSKNSISILGIEVNKGTYNAVTWLIIAALSTLLATGYISYKRNRSLTIQAKKEHEDLKKEFEAYRKASREAREKMSMAHFNELKKLRTG